MTALLLFAACLAAYGGFACLALAMPDHWEQCGGSQERARAWGLLRPAGLCLLALAYGLCVWRDGVSFGSLVWVILLSATAIGVAFTLTWLGGRRQRAADSMRST